MAEALRLGATYRDLDCDLKANHMQVIDDMDDKGGEPLPLAEEVQQLPAEVQAVPLQEKPLCELDKNIPEDAETAKVVLNALSLVPELFKEDEQFDCNLVFSKTKKLMAHMVRNKLNYARHSFEKKFSDSDMGVSINCGNKINDHMHVAFPRIIPPNHTRESYHESYPWF